MGNFYLGFPQAERCMAQCEHVLALARPCAGCPVGLRHSAGREACSFPCSTGPLAPLCRTCVQRDICLLWLLIFPFSMVCTTMKNCSSVKLKWWYTPFLPWISVRGRQRAWVCFEMYSVFTTYVGPSSPKICWGTRTVALLFWSSQPCSACSASMGRYLCKLEDKQNSAGCQSD